MKEKKEIALWESNLWFLLLNFGQRQYISKYKIPDFIFHYAFQLENILTENYL